MIGRNRDAAALLLVAILMMLVAFPAEAEEGGRVLKILEPPTLKSVRTAGSVS